MGEASKLVETLMQVASNHRIRMNVGAMSPAAIYEMGQRDFDAALAPIREAVEEVTSRAGTENCSCKKCERLHEALALLYPATTKPTAKDRLARSRGFDRRGIDCTCEWASSRHGTICPEHGGDSALIPVTAETEKQ